MRLRREVAEHKLKAAAQKKVGAVVEVISHRKSVCARCSMKGLSICNLSVGWLMEVPPGIPCIKRGGSSHHQTACVACHDDKAKCEWIINSNAGSEDTGGLSRQEVPCLQVPPSPVVLLQSWVPTLFHLHLNPLALLDPWQRIPERIQVVQPRK